MCDGIGCDGYVWKYVHRALVARYRVIHWHYRGHGRTPMPRDPRRITIADHADDLACVLDDAGVDHAVLMGHSMGVQVALETVRRHRQRAAALVLLCGAPGHPLKTFHGQDFLEPLLPGLRRTVARAPGLFNLLASALLPTKLAYAVATWLEVNGELLERGDFMPYLRGMSRVDLELFLDMLDAANQHSAVDLLPDIDVPTLVVAGRRDGFTPSSLSEEMQRAILDSELLLVEDGSHTAPIERPDLVCPAILEFLGRRLPPRRAAGPHAPVE